MLDAQQEAGIFTPEKLDEAQLVKYIEALIIYGKYDAAYAYIDKVRCERLNPKRVLRLCDYYIRIGIESDEPINIILI